MAIPDRGLAHSTAWGDMEPIVDVTIAVHSATRPIARAVGSVLSNTHSATRVNVVAHNIDPEVIRQNLGDWASDDRVRLLTLSDGIHSPAGPMNLGLEISTGQFLSVLGSDDEFEPGAIDSWLDLHQRSGADVVIPQIRNDRGGRELSPPARPRRSLSLDPVRDRLSYRSAPLGMFSREKFGELRFAEGLKSGEDIPFVTRLWFSGASIAFARTGPGYFVHTDADDRVTSAPRPIAEDFAFLDHIFGQSDLERMGMRERSAFVVKLIRLHLFDALVNRASAGEWPQSEREALADVARRMLEWADRPERMLSILDRRILDGILEPGFAMGDLMAMVGQRWNYRSLSVLLTRSPLHTLSVQGPLRTYAGAYFL